VSFLENTSLWQLPVLLLLLAWPICFFLRWYLGPSVFCGLFSGEDLKKLLGYAADLEKNMVSVTHLRLLLSLRTSRGFGWCLFVETMDERDRRFLLTSWCADADGLSTGWHRQQQRQISRRLTTSSLSSSKYCVSALPRMRSLMQNSMWVSVITLWSGAKERF
jgi:hypothetical protein